MRSLFIHLFTFSVLFLSFTAYTCAQKKIVATYSEQPFNGTLEPFDSVHYEYDANNKQVAWWSSYYDKTTATWKNLLRYEHTYNNAGDITSTLIKLWSNNAWVDNNIDTYIYENNLLKTIYQTRWYNNQWNSVSKKEYYYNSQNNEDSIVLYNYNNGVYTKSVKNIFTYNTNNQLNEDIDYYWETNLKSWIINLKKTYTYNSQGLHDQTTYSTKEQVGWKVIFLEELTYDSDKDVREIITKDGDGNLTRKKTYIYNSPATGVHTTTPLNSSIYPNPAHSTVKLLWNTNSPISISITDIFGKTIEKFEAITENEFQFSCAHLKSGIYYYTLKEMETGTITTHNFLVSH